MKIKFEPIFIFLIYRRFKKIAWIRSHHLHLKKNFKLLAGKFTCDDTAKHCWVMSTNFLFLKVCWQRPAMFCLYTSSKLFPRWRWWDQIQAIFLNLYFKDWTEWHQKQSIEINFFTRSWFDFDILICIKYGIILL